MCLCVCVMSCTDNVFCIEMVERCYYAHCDVYGGSGCCHLIMMVVMVIVVMMVDVMIVVAVIVVVMVLVNTYDHYIWINSDFRWKRRGVHKNRPPSTENDSNN